MPEENCSRVPEGLPLELAVLAEPLSIALHARHQAGALADKTIGIFGVGPIGLSILAVTRPATTGRIFVTDKIETRLAAALTRGANWTGNPDRIDVAAAIAKQHPPGLDVVFECCGQPEALDQAVTVLGPGGVLVLVGIPAGDRISLDISAIRRKEITIMNVRRQNNCVRPALELLSARPSDFTSLITHRFALADIGRAYDTVAGYRDGVIKALVLSAQV